jgi:Co/Zn/Cd efflux system component
MQKTTFKISKMDCPSEEQMIRMKLAHLTNITSLDFDISGRTLTVFHTDNHDEIFRCLDNLNFDTTYLETVAADDFTSSNVNKSSSERKLLWQVLSINFFLFILEITSGYFAKSMGLISDSLDMLADSIVYGLALYAVGGAIQMKKNIAKWAGYIQLTLSIFGLVEVIRRFLETDTMPSAQTMVMVALLALVGNAACLFLLQKSRSKEAHMQASMIFTSNDVIVNIGVIVAAGLVYLTNSQYPDLIIGVIVFLIVGKGSLNILKLSK